MNNLREITIAIDAMGGDFGPTAVVNGAFLASKKNRVPNDYMKEQLKGIDKYSGKNFTFLIVGEGPQKKRILDLINELDIAVNVKLLGHVEQVPELLSALDVFVNNMADTNISVSSFFISSL